MSQPARVPFRWDVSRREQLGRLVEGEPAEHYRGFVDDLRRCCTRLVALGGDSLLVFVGRSPESIFDYLSGLLAATSWSERLVLLNLSMRTTSAADVARERPHALAALREQFRALGLGPAEIAASPRPVAFLDLVWQGSTFGHLHGLLMDWARDDGVDLHAVRRRIRFVGITERLKNSPNTWRWYQRVEWRGDYPPGALRSVSIPWHLWTYLGDSQKKVSPSNAPDRWGTDEMLSPPRDPDHLAALRLALHLYERGRERAERDAFAAGLAAQPEMRHRWLRQLVLELRGG